MAQRYLVTGCAGFIASNVSRLLLEAGHEVVGVDNLNDAYDRRLKSWRLDRLRQQFDEKSFAFHQVDIADGRAIEDRFAADRSGDAPPYAAVLNLAARAGVRPSVDNPWIYNETNVVGSLNLLDLCRRHGVGKFVLASTSSLYGSHNSIPYSEDADVTRPLSPYAASKGAAETLAHTYHHLHGLDVSVLRYFTVYGPAGRPDMSVFRFVRRIHEGEPIVVFGDGTQRRDFTYVDDIAQGTVAALRPLGYEVINLGGDRPAALSDVIAQISKLVGREAQIESRPAHPADVDATWANIDKAKRLLGWTAEVSLDEGLSRSVQWYQQHREEMIEIELGDRR